MDAAVRKSEVVFIAVGTPPKENGETDLSQVESAARGIAGAMDRYKVIVNKSTVPVGTGDIVREIIETNRRRNVDFDVVSNPEFLREGSAISDTLEPDRIVIGAPNQIVAMKILELYAPAGASHDDHRCRQRGDDQIRLECLPRHQNLVSPTAIANICDAVGADVMQVDQGHGLRPSYRIGVPKCRSWAMAVRASRKTSSSLLHTAAKVGYDFPLLAATMETNEEQPKRFIERMRRHAGRRSTGKKSRCSAWRSKPNTDDMRDAKSLDVITALLAGGATVNAYDPICDGKYQEDLPANRLHEKCF